jgi:hydroxylysine kinase
LHVLSIVAGVIHGDFNEQNILVQCEDDSKEEKYHVYHISGIIDFGDSHESYLVFEVAIAIMYMMVESHVVAPLLVGGHVLAGYLSEIKLNPYERQALKTLVAGRFAQSLTMGEYTISQDPTNEYVMVTAKNGWPRLQQLWDTPKEELYAKWDDIIESYQEAKE